MGPRDQLERLDLWERGDIPDLLVHPESRVFLEEPAKKEQRETPAHKDPPVKTAPLASEVSLESEVYLELRVPRV